jgi:hypothetical protein
LFSAAPFSIHACSWVNEVEVMSISEPPTCAMFVSMINGSLLFQEVSASLNGGTAFTSIPGMP